MHTLVARALSPWRRANAVVAAAAHPLEPLRHRPRAGIDAFGPFVICECGDYFETPEQHAAHRTATLEETH